MASEPVIDHSDVAKAARDIHREYGGPGIMLKMADEIDRLRLFLKMSRINGAWDDHPDCAEVDALLKRGEQKS